MAEAVFRSMTSSNPYVSDIDSAGTDAYHVGDNPDPRTMSTLKENGIRGYTHEARKLRLSDFSKFDYILAMDKDNLGVLQRLRERAIANGADKVADVSLFGDFGGRQGEEVIDPYYGAKNGFKNAYEQMVRFSTGFVEDALKGVARNEEQA